MGATLSPRALCELDELKEYAKESAEDQGRDDMMIRLINAASSAIYAASTAHLSLPPREFVSVDAIRNSSGVVTVPATTRTFDLPIPRHGFRPGSEFWINDLAAFTSLTMNGMAISSQNVVPLPRNRQEWEPMTKIRLSVLVPLTGSAIFGNWTGPIFDDVSDPVKLAITGTWGFPQIPDDIRQACIVTAMVTLERDIKDFSETFSNVEQRVMLPRTLPRQVWDTVTRYQRPTP